VSIYSLSLRERARVRENFISFSQREKEPDKVRA